MILLSKWLAPSSRRAEMRYTTARNPAVPQPIIPSPDPDSDSQPCSAFQAARNLVATLGERQPGVINEQWRVYG